MKLVIVLTCLLLGAAAPVAASTLNFNGSAVAACTLSGSNYTCTASAFDPNLDISIGHGVSVSGNLIGRDVTLDNAATIVGSVTATNVSLGPHASISGSVSASDTVDLSPNSEISGDITADTVVVANNADVDGSVAARVVTRGPHGSISHAVECSGGASPSCACQNVSGDPTSCSTVAALHHFMISHPGSALTCTPQPVTVSACANAACSSLYGGGADVTLSPGGLTFAIGASGINAAASVHPTVPGSVTISASSTSATSGAATCLNTGTGASSCAMTAADAGFLFSSVASHAAETSQHLSVSAVKKADNSLACTPAFASISKTVNLSCAYSDPSSGTLPVRLGANVPLGAGLASACTSGGRDFALAFDASGVAALDMIYADVGKVQLNASYAGAGVDAGLSMTGSTSFISVPASFGFSVFKQAVAPNKTNPGAPDAAGGAFVMAGEAFLATITALNSGAAATPNFGREGLAESVALSRILVAPTTLLTGGANPPLTDVAGAYVAGASVHSLTWAEVGIIKIGATLANPNGYLGTASAPTFKPPANLSANVGRFTPAYYTTTVVAKQPCPAALSGTCPAVGFAYSGQPFSVTVTAYNLDGTESRNFGKAASPADTFARTVTLSGWGAAGSTAVSNPPASPVSLGMSANTGSMFDAGIGTITPAYNFSALYPASASPAAPTNVFVRADDSDGVSSLRGVSSVEGGLMVLAGRLYIAHNYGSELVAAPVSVYAQYWDGAHYVSSNTDSVNSILLSDVRLADCRKNLAAGVGQCSSAAALVATPASVQLNAGAARLRLRAPGAGNSGSVDVTTVAPAWLPSTTGRIVFGIYKAVLLHRQEVY
ncbi:MAG: polymer-forming cytoskeletal protein [Pseudomonadota bacterium]